MKNSIKHGLEAQALNTPPKRGNSILRIEHLYTVSFLVGAVAVFFDTAIISFLPTVVQREDLIEGNSKLRLSGSVASTAGPGIAGLIVQLITAPLAIIFDAISFLVSALCIKGISQEERLPISTDRSPGIWHEIGEGLRVLKEQPILRSITVASGIGSFALGIQQTIFILFLARELGIGAALLGFILASEGIASLLGALLAGRIGLRWGPGPAIIISAGLACVGMWLISFSSGSVLVATIMLIAAKVLYGAGASIYQINQISLYQAITPDELLGRVNASRRFIVVGIKPISALLSGMLGETIGLRPTLIFGAFCIGFMVLWLLRSPLRTLREQPSPMVQKIS